MPYASKDKSRAWTKQAIRNGYGKWLYQRRKLVYQDAELFKVALEGIENCGDRTAVQIARLALKQSRKRWSTLGPAHPHTHKAGAKVVLEDSGADSLLQAIEKLGLPTSRS